MKKNQIECLRIPTIAFIDDGICKSMTHTCLNFEDYNVKNGRIIVNDSLNPYLNHASICYEVFKTYVKVNYNLISIKIMESSDTLGNAYDLYTALIWCLKKKVNIIHLSVGTGNYYDFAIINKAIAKIKANSHIVIVAACDNRNTLTMPACLDGVIGVRNSNISGLKNNFYYNPNAYDNIDVTTNIKQVLVSLGDNDEMIECNSNSFGVPYVAARICNYYVAGIHNNKKMKSQLIRDSVSIPLLKNSENLFMYYKSILRSWNDIDVPVVALVTQNSHDGSALSKLITEFRKKDYRVICISLKTKTSFEKLIFNLSDSFSNTNYSELIKLYFNFTKPDLIIYECNPKSLNDLLGENFQVELIVTSDELIKQINCESKIVSITTNTFENILSLLE